jgi:RNA polymerase sigma factor (sigma-70 family)
MAKREVHSHKKQPSDPHDGELLTESQITDRDFLESVYGRKLRLFARRLFKGKEYGGDGPDDLVQHAIAAVVDGEKEWKGHTVKSLRSRLRVRVKRDFIDLTRKYGLKHHAELEEVDTITRGIQPAKVVLQMTDLQSYIRFLQRCVPNVKGEHKYIHLWLAGYTVPEAAKELGMSVKRVEKMRERILEAIRERVTPDMIRGY